MPPSLTRLALIAAAGVLASACHAESPAADSARELSVAGATVHLAFEPDAFGAGPGPILEWVQRSADIVARYYGRFPTPVVTVRIGAEPGEGVHGGRTFANPDAVIRVRAGRDVTAAQLRSDWVLVHEMTHLALPDTGETHAWLSEGIATYVEGVARVQAGNRSESDVWAEELRSMPRGMPDEGDRGLDARIILGPHLLGRGDVLPARGRGYPPAHRNCASGCRTRCARCCAPAAGSRRTGRSSACCTPATRQSAPTRSRICTRRCAPRPWRPI